MCIVTQRDNVLHDFEVDDTLENLYSIPFKRYKHKLSVPHSFKLIVISIEPVVDHSCKNGWEIG